MAQRDPFSRIPDIAGYLPRPATERALGLLAEAAHRGDRPVVLAGPPGIGKTLLLHLLADRMLSDQRPVFVPIPTLPPAEFWQWIVASLGLEGGSDPLGALEQSHASGLPVSLLIDDATSLPFETIEALRAALDSQKPGLRAVLVVTEDGEEDEGRAAFDAALGEPVHRVEFVAPMSAEESVAYVSARLAASGIDARTRARFDDAMLARLHALAGGVPAALHELADLLIRPDEAARSHEYAADLLPEIVSSAAARRTTSTTSRSKPLPTIRASSPARANSALTPTE